MNKLLPILMLIGGIGWGDTFTIGPGETYNVDFSSDIKCLTFDEKGNPKAWVDDTRIKSLEVRVKKLEDAQPMIGTVIKHPCRVFSCTTLWCPDSNPGCNTCTCAEGK